MYTEKEYLKCKKNMNLVDGEEFKDSLLAVLATMSDTVAKTLGPFAHTTVLDDGIAKYPTKDGWNIINRITYQDPLYNSFARLISNISFQQVEEVGDGTTSALVASSYFAKALNSSDLNKYRQKDINDMIIYIRDLIIEVMKTNPEILHTIDIETEEGLDTIYKIALVSSNYNVEIASYIKEIYAQTKNPNIHVSISPSKTTEYKINKGFRFDAKPIALNYFKNSDDGSYHNNNEVAVAVIDHNVTYARHYAFVHDMIAMAISHNAPMLIVIAPNFDDTFGYTVQTTIKEYVGAKKVPPIMLVQCAMNNEKLRNTIVDLCKIIGVDTVNTMDIDTYELIRNNDVENHKEDLENIAKSYGVPVENLSAMHIVEKKIGVASNITVTKKHIICDLVDNDAFQSHVADIKEEYERAKKLKEGTSSITTGYNDIYLRYTRLTGNMGAIEVGGGSDIEKQCLRDSIDDAVLSCKAALEDGYVPGMNMSILRSAINTRAYFEQMLEKEEVDKDPILLIIAVTNCIISAFSNTIVEIFRNKFNPSNDEERNAMNHIVNDIIDNCYRNNATYNLMTDQYEVIKLEDREYNVENIVEGLNVINPINTDIQILHSMTSILSHLLTSNQLLTMNTYMRNTDTREELEQKEKEKWIHIGASIVQYFLDAKKVAETTVVSDETPQMMDEPSRPVEEEVRNIPPIYMDEDDSTIDIGNVNE